MLAFLISKHCIFHVFDVNLAPFSIIFMSNPLSVCFVEMEEKKDKNQENWTIIEEAMQIVVIVATTAFMVVAMTQDWW